MKVQILTSILVLIGVISYAQAINIKSGGGSLQSVKQAHSDDVTLAQKRSNSDTESQVDIEANSRSEQFIIDDFFIWIWCKITNCEKKPEGPEEKKAPKQEKQVVVVEETKKTPKEENKSNSTNATDEAKPENPTPATPAKKQQPGSPTPPEAPPAPQNNEPLPPPEPKPLPSDEELSKQIKDRKDKQNAVMNAGGVGDKESKKSETAQVPASNPLRDDQSTAQAKAKSALAHSNQSKSLVAKNQTSSSKNTPKDSSKVSSKIPLKVEVPKGRSQLKDSFDDSGN